MKLRFYCDVFLPLMNSHQFYATTNPGKQCGGQRLAFDVVIPDHMIYGNVIESPEVGRVELVADHSNATTPPPAELGKGA